MKVLYSHTKIALKLHRITAHSAIITRICAAEMAVYDMRPSARAEKYMCVILIR